MFLAESSFMDPVTLGIAIALFFGEFAFFKWIHDPAIVRFDKALAAAEERHKLAMIAAEERHRVELNTANARADRLETKVDRQNEVLEDKALPALIAATTSVAQFQTFMQELRAEQEELKKQREIQEAIAQGRTNDTKK